MRMVVCAVVVGEIILSGCADKGAMLAQCQLNASNRGDMERPAFLEICMRASGYSDEYLNPNNKFCHLSDFGLENEECYRSNNFVNRAIWWAFGRSAW
jgi:hypothetical protein